MTDELDDVDVRIVTVIWREDEDEPELEFTGCSPYEARGMLEYAIDELRDTYGIRHRPGEPEEDDD